MATAISKPRCVRYLWAWSSMQGLVAVIVTVHELAVLLGALSGLVLGLLSWVLFRADSPTQRTALATTFDLDTDLLIFGLSAHLLDVAPLDVEVVSVD
ncbi:MAG: hypothetical protein IT382_25110 [Deltaproteobacteria bacterium]|nr:hypothetical protein [Deltaproteobacteria bacterium]